MDAFINFIKEYWFLVALAGIALVFAILLTYHFTRSKYARDRKEKKEHVKFDKSMERIEKRMYKKCKKCGSNVPIEDRICMTCGQMPD